MSREHPASPQWAAYYRTHEHAADAWGESNGWPPNHDGGCRQAVAGTGRCDWCTATLCPCWCHDEQLIRETAHRKGSS